MNFNNRNIAKIFNKIADLLELKGENPFKVKAYRNAAAAILTLSRPLLKIIEEKEDLTQIKGIGKSLAEQIVDTIQNGYNSKLKELEKEFPKNLDELLKLEGLGPKKLKVIFDHLSVNTLEELKKALEQNKIRELPGMGIKTEENLIKSLQKAQLIPKRKRIDEAEDIVNEITNYLKNTGKAERVEVAGSLRRHMETVGDIDILALSDNGRAIRGKGIQESSPRGSGPCRSNGQELVKKFTEFDEVERVISQGTTRSTVVLNNDMQVDLRVIDKNSYGAALLYFTGSKEHNIAIRNLAIKRGMKINEYGVFDLKTDKRVAGKSEEEIYKLLGMQYIPPELRENRGEIEAALKNELPILINENDIKGDLHAHTIASDGKNTILEMATAALKKGYQYLAITDHTQNVRIAGGMAAKEYAFHLEAIDKVNDKIKGITILKGAEVDILEDGSLDLPPHILKKLDLMVISIHSHFKLNSNQQTDRILRALDNSYFQILGHPTGRLIGRRHGYEIDLQKILKEMKGRNKAVELNSYPDRLDLNDIHLKIAKDMGIKIVISTDSHSAQMLSFIKYGINQARRGWLTAEDVLNTLSLEGLRQVMNSVKC